MTALTTLYNLKPIGLAQMIARTFGLALSNQFRNGNRLRREVIAQRIRLYRDDSKLDFERMIATVFETDKVIRQRMKMIDVASELNVTARIVDEVASLYDQPAMRSFKGDDAMTERFSARATELELDEVMQEAHRLTFLCNEVLLWSVATEEGEKPELQIVTPDCFDVIAHPANKLRMVGILLDTAPSYVAVGVDKSKVKQYELWDDEFTYHLTANGELIGDPIAHDLGRIPGVLFHRRKPVDRLLDCRAGGDITSAHLGAGLLEVMIMRLAKAQGERQPMLSGNLANAASKQSMDGETPIVLPPDVVADMLDTKTSPEHYLLAKKDKLSSVALRHGMSYEQLTHTASETSGVSYIARRMKLMKLRLEQRRRARIHERETVKLMGFDPDKLRVDHQEQAAPADAAEKLAILKDKVALGLDSIIKHMMREDPDLSREDAVLEFRSNLRDRAMMVLEMRALNMPADATTDNVGNSPQDNGAQKQLPPGSDETVDDGSNDGSGTPVDQLAS